MDLRKTGGQWAHPDRTPQAQDPGTKDRHAPDGLWSKGLAVQGGAFWVESAMQVMRGLAPPGVGRSGATPVLTKTHFLQ